MPYDVAVCTVLLRAAITIPAFEIESDGEWQRDWQAARLSVTAQRPNRFTTRPATST
jgi:hypothetical protein